MYARQTRITGDPSGTSCFESRAALEASEAALRDARDRTADVARSGSPQVCVLEVAIDRQV